MGLELLHGLVGVVDEGETSGLSTTVLRAEAEDVDLVLGSLVKLSELLAELILGNVGAVGVEDVTTSAKTQTLEPFLLSHSYIPPTTIRFAMLAMLMMDRGVRLQDHLLAGEQRVADELASPQGNGGVGHDGGC